MVNTVKPAKLEDLLNLFTDVVSPEDVMYAKIMVQISSVITKERITLGMDQKEFAKHIHISHRTLSQIESGDYDISLKELSKIASFLNMDLQLDLTSILEENTNNIENNIKKFIEMVANGENMIDAGKATDLINMSFEGLLTEICKVAWQLSCKCDEKENIKIWRKRF